MEWMGVEGGDGVDGCGGWRWSDSSKTLTNTPQPTKYPKTPHNPQSPSQPPNYSQTPHKPRNTHNAWQRGGTDGFAESSKVKLGGDTDHHEAELVAKVQVHLAYLSPTHHHTHPRSLDRLHLLEGWGVWGGVGGGEKGRGWRKG